MRLRKSEPPETPREFYCTFSYRSNLPPINVNASETSGSGISLVHARKWNWEYQQTRCLPFSSRDQAVPSGEPRKHHIMEIRRLDGPIRDIGFARRHGSAGEVRCTCEPGEECQSSLRLVRVVGERIYL
jgi:hypothetical protein